ncbi:MAG: hypothetical protein JXA21_19160 [Anaerolineae bacterium]|nr:hypothetical protein [Anaerolineae bacterium]
MFKAILIALLVGIALPLLGLTLLCAKRAEVGCLLPFSLFALFVFIVLVLFI